MILKRLGAVIAATMAWSSISAAAEVAAPPAALAPCVDPAELSGTVQLYFEELSGPRGHTDMAGLDQILLPEFRVDVIGRDEKGQATYFGHPRDEFIDHMRDYRARTGYYHSLVTSDVRCSGRVASATGRFVSRNDPGGAIIDKGWFAFNMIIAKDRWQIAHATWFSEGGK